MELTVGLYDALSTLVKKHVADPWALLMIQTLVWCFRRWAIFYLTSEEITTSMREFVWESQLDLVDQFSPPDLREFAILWMNPDHVGDRIDVIQELNGIFLRIVDAFDHALITESDEEQNALADFIDMRITELFDETLAKCAQYRIYPTQDDSPDSFSTVKIYKIMETILDKFVQPSAEAVAVDSKPPEPMPVPASATVAAALNRRRTMRLRKRTQQATRKNTKHK